MSKPDLTDRDVPETVVRNRSQYTNTLHRRDSESDETQPACPTRSTDKEYVAVPAASYLGHYKLCGNPECFGGEWR
jgi:hypothetical protein